MPLATSIIQKRKNIFIYDESGNRLWDAPISYLGATMDDEGTLIPQSFHFLRIQQWMTCRILYQLAKIIQDNYPAIDIDWINVFSSIEKFHFVDTIATKKAPIQELNTPKSDAWFEVLAEKNLREYGVIR